MDAAFRRTAQTARQKKIFQDAILLSFGYVMIKEKGAKQYEF
jgi:hypothetical protein